MQPDSEQKYLGERDRLTRLAYRMLGSWADAEDVAQEALMRLEVADGVENPAAWLTTVATRLSLDLLKSARLTREQYVGPWLPEPVDARSLGPAEQVERADTLTFAFLVALDALDPVQRAVFILRDVFGEPYSTVSSVVDRSEANCRQIGARARRKLRSSGHLVDGNPPTADSTDGLLEACVSAALGGDVARLESLLADDVVHMSDGGADRHAARRPVSGRTNVARFLVNIAKRTPDNAAIELRHCAGSAALLVFEDGEPTLWLSVDPDASGRRVRRVWAVLNPSKLGGFASS